MTWRQPSLSLKGLREAPGAGKSEARVPRGRRRRCGGLCGDQLVQASQDLPGFSTDIWSPWKPVMPRQAGTLSHMDLQQGVCSVGQAPSPGCSSLDGRGR